MGGQEKVKFKHKSTDWQQLLPQAFQWLEAAKFSHSQTIDKGTHVVVPVEKTQSLGKSICSGVSSQTFSTMEKLAKQAGWNSSSSKPLTLVLDGIAYSLVGVSTVKRSPLQLARQVGLDAAKLFKQNYTVEKISFCDAGDLTAFDIFSGFAQGCYSLTGFKNKSSSLNLPKQVEFCCANYSQDTLEDHCQMLQGTFLARMIADAPPNWLDSEKFAEIAASMAKKLNLKCTVLGREEILKNKLGAFHSVAEGTTIDPKLIAIEIEGVDSSRCVSLVGKGLTFDAGGVNIKPSAGISDMKYDLCGGAAVLGAAYYLGHKKPPTNVVCLIGAVENMLSINPSRPGDIVHTRNGKTIEILNTDAEGRLVLADLLQYSIDKYKPEFIIDIATLTGAVLMALGSVGSACMSNDQAFADFVMSSGNKSGEPLWQLPLWPEFNKEVKSEFADLKNIAGPSVKAGTIMGGAFLQEFVGENKWLHLDIAGTGWGCTATGFPSHGGSGFGVRTLSSACMNWEG